MKKTKTSNYRYGRLHLHIIHILVWLGAVTCVVVLYYHRIQRVEVLVAPEKLHAESVSVASADAASDISSNVSTFRTIESVVDVNSEQKSSAILSIRRQSTN